MRTTAAAATERRNAADKHLAAAGARRAMRVKHTLEGAVLAGPSEREKASILARAHTTYARRRREPCPRPRPGALGEGRALDARAPLNSARIHEFQLLLLADNPIS